MRKICLLLSMLSISLTTFANEKPVLNIYTYDSFISEYGPGPKLKENFEALHEVTVNFVAAEDAISMLNKVRLEGDKSKADLVIGLDQNMLADIENTDLFVKNKVDLTQLKLPQTWDNQTFLPYDYGQFAFIYNKEKIKTPPKSLTELIENPEIKVIYQDPRTSSVGQGLLFWVNSVYKDNAKTAWEKLATHTVTVAKGWSATYGLFLKGESDVVLSYTTSELYHKLMDKTDKYAALIFADGHPVQIELAAKTKFAKDPELADKFLQFLLDKESQKSLAFNNWMLPVIQEEVDPLLTPLTKIKILEQTKVEKSTLKNWIQEWQLALTK